jgi:PadR family transcriptional regulator PadR
MSTKPPDREALVQGTLDLLVLRTLVLGPQHGHGIACSIEMQSRDTLIVDHGSLYPALQRLEKKKWIKARWGTSTNNRRARFYEITAAGRKQLQTEASRWRRIAEAMSRVLGPDFAAE